MGAVRGGASTFTTINYLSIHSLFIIKITLAVMNFFMWRWFNIQFQNLTIVFCYLKMAKVAKT